MGTLHLRISVPCRLVTPHRYVSGEQIGSRIKTASVKYSETDLIAQVFGTLVRSIQRIEDQR